MTANKNIRPDMMHVQTEIRRAMARARIARQGRLAQASAIAKARAVEQQHSLFDDIDLHTPVRPPMPAEDDSIEARFLSFHRANPHILTAMRRVATIAKQRGYKSWSIWGVLDRIRWEQTSPTSTTEPWRVNNSFTPIYARLIMAMEPMLRGFFKVRRTNIDIEFIFSELGITENSS